MEQPIRTVPNLGIDGPARVLIVDDHPAVCEGIASRISRQTDLIVCGEAADVAEALRLVETSQPDVVVIDISLKDGNGFDLIKRIKLRDGSIRMLVCSMHPDSLYAERALRAGAIGYINKENTTGRILDAIRSVQKGEVYLSENASRPARSRSALPAIPDSLSNRSPIVSSRSSSYSVKACGPAKSPVDFI